METPGYFGEEFCRNMAWIDLILLANHDSNFFHVRGIRVDVHRGQVGYGLDQLSRRWKWSRGKIERFLKFLEIEKKIVRQKDNVTTLISLCNYSEYQDGDNPDRQQAVKQPVKQTDTNKNVKNVKNDKKNTGSKKKSTKKIPVLFEESEYFEKAKFSDALFGTSYQDANVDYYHEAAWRWSKSKPAKKADWLATVKNWMDRDREEGKFKTLNSSSNGTHIRPPAGHGKNHSTAAGAEQLLAKIQSRFIPDSN